ncbi:MAG TPA: hypothetical protein PK734_00575 [Bacteroidales bacterium]|nr:MAG: hypothetical protein BWY22_00935 [Bacteroidetes bacterium ADurb.Bin217]HPM11965.1 hypothetical protein [Bacteroidales bacterium]
MDLQSIIIGAIITIACILPFILLRYKRVRIEKQLRAGLQAIATQNHKTIQTDSVYVDFAIGIDTRNEFVFFYKKNAHIEIRHAICLKDIDTCKIKDISSDQTKTNPETTSGLFLCLVPKNKNVPEFALEFFNYETSYQLHVDKKPIEKWESLISKYVG